MSSPAGFRIRLRRTVITSYSIHYTKLYDIIPQEITFEIGLSKTLSAKAEAFINTVIAHLRASGIEVVITSYSIHYTKLYEPLMSA